MISFRGLSNDTLGVEVEVSMEKITAEEGKRSEDKDLRSTYGLLVIAVTSSGAKNAPALRCSGRIPLPVAAAPTMCAMRGSC